MRTLIALDRGQPKDLRLVQNTPCNPPRSRNRARRTVTSIKIRRWLIFRHRLPSDTQRGVGPNLKSSTAHTMMAPEGCHLRPRCPPGISSFPALLSSHRDNHPMAFRLARYWSPTDSSALAQMSLFPVQRPRAVCLAPKTGRTQPTEAPAKVATRGTMGAHSPPALATGPDPLGWLDSRVLPKSSRA